MQRLSILQKRHSKACDSLITGLEQDRLHHAYIIVAQLPSESRHVAEALAATLLCTHETGTQACDPCGECSGCSKYIAGSHPDFFRLAPDEKGRIKIDQIRTITARLGLRAAESKTKVVIIDSAHSMNGAAQNALLKTLEEPPGPTCFILSTNRYRSLLPTVRSRSQRLLLSPVKFIEAKQSMATRLSEAGLDTQLSGVLSAMFGEDIEEAKLALDEGAGEIAASLSSLSKSSATMTELLEVAADLGGDKKTLALALIELWIRDALALKHGASPEYFYFDAEDLELSTANLAHAADTVRLLNATRAFNLNKTMSFESLLFSLRPCDA